MFIYIDVVILINFITDFSLLLTVSSVLKRKTNIKRIVLSSLIGELSIIHLFVNFNNILLFVFKLLLSLIMVITCFKYDNLKYTITNYVYLFMTSFILGGTLLFLKNEGINYLLLFLITPIILYSYLKTQKSLTTNYAFYYPITICLSNNEIISTTSFLDTGNKLKDPISNKGIIILEKELLDGLINIRSPIYIPYNSLNNHSLLKCIKPKYIEVNNHIFTNYLIGISEDTINLDGVKCILNYKMMEELNA